jgi:hypothetical protein
MWMMGEKYKALKRMSGRKEERKNFLKDKTNSALS